MEADKNALKRYNLVLPQELFDELQNVATSRHTTVVEILKKFIKLGLMAMEVEETRDAVLLIREGNTEKQIILL